MKEKEESEFVTRNRVRPSAKALILFSGGLDSMIAARLIMDQGLGVEAVAFITPFSSYNETFGDEFCEEWKIRLHKIFLGEEFLEILVNPNHGYGSQMNPCLDCRILMLKKAKKIAKSIGADFIVTGEVVGERPFTQRKDALLFIERKAELEGCILRPLSAKLLPETTSEKTGLVSRQKLLDIEGKKRDIQINIARKLGITSYPNPAGGCLLTEPRFVARLREHLDHERTISLDDVEILKLGRHLRIDELKVVVGRNEKENQKLAEISNALSMPQMEVISFMSPIALVLGEENIRSLQIAAECTARYSDAPEKSTVKVRYIDSQKQEHILEVEPIDTETANNLII